jgi:hypothetical protein
MTSERQVEAVAASDCDHATTKHLVLHFVRMTTKANDGKTILRPGQGVILKSACSVARELPPIQTV